MVMEGGREPSGAARDWIRRLGEKGWGTPTWPVEYGGGGLNNEQTRIFKQELARIKARPPLESFGISIV